MAESEESMKPSGTVVVFAELYRDSPLVRGVPWRKFTLLFRKDDTHVRVRHHWHCSEEKADYAVTVERGKGCSENEWAIKTHVHSPTLRIDLNDRPEPEAKRMQKFVRAREVVRFSFASIWRQREIRMALFDWNDQSTCNKEPATYGRLHLLSMPSLVLQKIFGNVCSERLADMTFTLPFVSRSILQVVKTAVPDDSHLILKQQFFNRRDLEAIRSLCHMTCASLLVEFDEDVVLQDKSLLTNEMLQTLYSTLLGESKWPQLKCLDVMHWNVREECTGLKPELLNSWTRNNFPALESLSINLLWSSDEDDDFTGPALMSWQVLDGCRFSHLKTLKLQISRESPALDKAELWRNLATLENLSLKICNGLPWDGLLSQPEDGPAIRILPILPRLQTLQLSGDPQFTRSSMEREFAQVDGSSLKKLVLYLYGGQVLTLSAAAIFCHFPKLESLRLSASVKIHLTEWERVPAKNLMHLTSFIDCLDAPFAIPFGKMLSLEDCYLMVTGWTAMSNPQYVQSLKSLTALPKLRRLSVCGDVQRMLTALLDPSSGLIKSNVTFLRLGCSEPTTGLLDTVQVHLLRKLLSSCPGLQELRLIGTYNQAQVP